MQALEIASVYFIKKIVNPEDIFLIDVIFENACFWSRESCRELFQKNPNRQDLVRKIDDVGSEVDRYMYDKRFKMLKNAKKGKNSLSNALVNSESTIKWFIERWINIFMNISTNSKYKAYIDVGSIGLELNENISYSEDALVLMIKEEEKLEYEKQQQMEIKKWDKNLIKMVGNGQIGGESTESGRTQMILIF
ncbi:hypothetical protein [Sulfurimonas hydrogeniphila]|uniref:hypothetical protein n=1 Tax=Sulfurimonas hydrogeniphila TaxID=2509341 RepID=UPI00125FCCE5|nr:hypothetical protein [Sulfurimonas hydrogeniphila]